MRFNLNGDWLDINEIEPSLTILSFLRTNMSHSSVKEGCAAGDCGACTLMVAKPMGDSQFVFYSINSCIALVAHLNGCYVFTSSGIGSVQNMHPSQQAMVDFHGAQCGFCTPGIVMSLATMYQQRLRDGVMEVPLSDDDIHHALSGNLCRCTGYVPIVQAAKAMTSYSSIDLMAKLENQGVQEYVPDSADTFDTPLLLKDGNAKEGRKLFQPTTEQELQKLLQTYPEAWLWSGGTDLGLEVTQQLQQPATIIHLERIASMRSVKEADQEITLGALCTYTDLETELHTFFPSFTQLVQRIASRQIRNLGTLGGNIANASPIGDLPPVFLVLNATLLIDGTDEAREQPLNEFFLGYKKTTLHQGEYIRAVRIPKLSEDEQLFCWKVSKRQDDDISAVMMAVWLKTDGQKVIDIRIACGGMAATPKRAQATEQALISQPFTLSRIQQASHCMEQDYQPMSDVRATSSYRMLVAKNLLNKMILEYQAVSDSEANV